MKIIFVLILTVVCHHSIFASSTQSNARPVQFLSFTNGTFNFDVDKLIEVLQVDSIKDRHLVIVSIVGAHGVGKSFLMNFFIRYLDAQYNDHNLSDWMRVNDKLTGFDWGRRHTQGISMWPEIFTYDNTSTSEKIAIILLDTEGFFNIKSRNNDLIDSTTFAITAMASSVQCYNVLREIQSFDMEYVKFFGGYASLAELNDIENEKLFQKLIFVVRDAPRMSRNFKYGWEKSDQINENCQKYNISANYEQIDKFYMPSPGDDVTQTAHFDGDLHLVSESFKENVKALAHGLFAPENLVVKEINGKKIRVSEMIGYLQRHADKLKSGEFLSPRNYLQAILDLQYAHKIDKCFDEYRKQMQEAFDTRGSPFTEEELSERHIAWRDEALEMFSKQKGLNEKEYLSTFERRLSVTIDAEFQRFKHINENRRHS